jgi:predicted signal transduction protein with EAL and GGDEF domain
MSAMEDIQAVFFGGCAEGMAAAEAGLATMASGDATADTVAAVFRAVHSIKGVTGSSAPADVLRTAHNAACDARSEQVSVTSYSRWNDERHQRRFRLLNDFGAALQGPGQLRLVVQPRIDLRSGACVGAQTLLRWTHPEFGRVSAAEFIPIIEQTSMARPMTRWVLRAALQQLAAWRAADLNLDLSINVSAANLEESDFAAQVQLALRDHGIRPTGWSWKSRNVQSWLTRSGRCGTANPPRCRHQGRH